MFEEIRDNALRCGYALTDNQVNAILIRHRQLVKEGQSIRDNFVEKQRQVNYCWRIRDNEKYNDTWY